MMVHQSFGVNGGTFWLRTPAAPSEGSDCVLEVTMTSAMTTSRDEEDDREETEHC